jgi:hypothetical protein
MCPYGASLRETGKRLSRFWRAAFISAGAIAVVASGVGPAIAQTAVGPTVTSKVSTLVPKQYGYTFVPFDDTYQHDKYETATISGAVSGATSGNVAQLYAQPFPYKHAPAAVAGQQLVLDGSSSETYSFHAIPGIATRYSVEVLTSATATTPPLATSPSSMVYVATDQWLTGFRTCNPPRRGQRPVCHQTVHVYTLVPASAYRTESRLKFYFYFAVALNASHIPAAPIWVYLNRDVVKISAAKKISSHEFEQTVTLAYRIGDHDAYSGNYDFCSKSAEPSDGVNLPGHHHCGDKRVKASWFLG